MKGVGGVRRDTHPLLTLEQHVPSAHMPSPRSPPPLPHVPPPPPESTTTDDGSLADVVAAVVAVAVAVAAVAVVILVVPPLPQAQQLSFATPMVPAPDPPQNRHLFGPAA